MQRGFNNFVPGPKLQVENSRGKPTLTLKQQNCDTFRQKECYVCSHHTYYICTVCV